MLYLKPFTANSSYGRLAATIWPDERKCKGSLTEMTTPAQTDLQLFDGIRGAFGERPAEKSEETTRRLPLFSLGKSCAFGLRNLPVERPSRSPLPGERFLWQNDAGFGPGLRTRRSLRKGEGMDGLRVVKGKVVAQAPCSRCQASGCPWDRIVGEPICPDCQESLAQGEGEPLVVRTEKHRCAVCQHQGTLRYVTYPLHAAQPVEMDLCARHFQALLARRLDRHAYHQLSRQLQALGFTARQVFLLHEAFYDDQGRSLQPVPEW